jgi:class 3 adenylate cyclase/tetratricopeptide (TPR) repeat protein
VVTALFCDLVGFTASSESADPEDVDAMLSRYFVMAQAAIENFGGVVEKYIGDAVVGVFGVPAAHEDDPERAVRAGLRIMENAERLAAVDGTPLLLRVGVNTGEALVRVGVLPGSGDGFVTGDAINTAARIQAVAPPMGVAVGQGTYQVTEQVFDYLELSPASVKGKSEPVSVFQAVQPRARFGTDITRAHDSPFIGREIDLALLKGIFDKTVAAGSVQLVTVVGEPGLGKSRIVAELFNYIDARTDLITWRQGRCLPYGDGITFWALGEIVKAHAGILETDPPAVATAKLDVVLPEGSERAWFRQRLLPLLGIEATSTAERDELFTAWRRFLEHVTEDGPTVVVFEDLHWADEAMLAFIDHLADRAEGVPLLIVGTARPELFEQHPDFGIRLRNSHAVNLVPLSDAETARLVAALLDTTVLPAELQGPILDRAGGNPLYAEEFVRLLKDRDLLIAAGTSWALREGADMPFPDSVQALIAARLDTLTPEAKSLLADAAVVGKVFWAGAVAAMSGRETDEVGQVLRELSRKELVRPSRRSTIESEVEYGFFHVLTRDVAYGQLPRASRAARHVAAAQWIEAKAADRVEDLADVLAYHYATALDLATAAGDTRLTDDLVAPALRFLTLAGQRALGLDTATALTDFEHALTLTTPGHPGRAAALARYGQAALHAGRYGDAEQSLQEAVATFQEQQDFPAAAAAMATLAQVYTRLGDPRAWKLPAETLALLAPLPPGPELVAALSQMAANETLQGRHHPAIDYADQALTLADQLGLDQPARALGYRGSARANLGDPAGLADYREAIELATETGQGREVALLHNNYGMDLWLFEGPAAAIETMQAGLAYAAPRGLTEMADAMAGSTLSLCYDVGRQAMQEAVELAERFDESGNVFDLCEVRAAEIRIQVLRGQTDQVAGWLDWLSNAARESGDPQMIAQALAAVSAAHAALNQPETATALLAKIDATDGTRDTIYYSIHLPDMVRTSLSLGQPALAEQLLARVEPRHPYTEHALVAANAALTEQRRDHGTAADSYADADARWEAFGVVPEAAFALLGQGRCLIALGRTTDASPVLQRARHIFDQLQAAPALAEIDTLLGEATALIS